MCSRAVQHPFQVCAASLLASPSRGTAEVSDTSAFKLGIFTDGNAIVSLRPPVREKKKVSLPFFSNTAHLPASQTPKTRASRLIFQVHHLCQIPFLSVEATPKTCIHLPVSACLSVRPRSATTPTRRWVACISLVVLETRRAVTNNSHNPAVGDGHAGCVPTGRNSTETVPPNHGLSLSFSPRPLCSLFRKATVLVFIITGAGTVGTNTNINRQLVVERVC
jgi:hypothetical protein